MFHQQIDFVRKYKFEILFWLLFIPTSLTIFTYHPLSSDEGVVLNMAWQMFSGKKLYVDFYEYLSPGSGYATYLLWKLFDSTSYIIPALFTWLLWLISSIYLYLLSLKLTNKKLISYGIITSWLLFIFLFDKINHNLHSTYTSIILLYYIFEYTRTEKKRHLIVASAMAAITTFFLHTKGLTVLLASILTISLFTKKSKVSRIIFFILIFIITNIILYSPWNITDLIQYIIIFPFEAKYIQTSEYSTEIIVVQIGIILLMTIFSLFRKKNKYWILTIFQIALFFSSAYNINQAHLRINIFPFIIFYFLVIDYILDYKKISSTLKKRIFSAIMLGVVVVIGIKIAIANNDKHFLITDILQTKPTIEEIESYNIEQAQYIYAGPFLPGVYYELNKPNPFIYTHNMLYCLGECQTKTLEIIKNTKPEYAMMSYYYITPAYDQDNPVDNFIKQNYMYCQQTSGHLEIYALHNCPPSI